MFAETVAVFPGVPEFESVEEILNHDSCAVGLRKGF